MNSLKSTVAVVLGLCTAVPASYFLLTDVIVADVINHLSSNKPAPMSGIYASANGILYKVNTNGPSALSIQGPEKQCLMFWRDEHVPADQIVERLDGQECSNHTFGDLDWRADYDYSKPNRFLLYPPDGEPFLIALKTPA